MSPAKPRNAWVHPIGLIGVGLALLYYATRSDAIGGMAIALLALAGIGSVIGTMAKPAARQPRPAGGSLAGGWIRHGGRVVVVTADPDAPAPRRTVAVLTGDGEEERWRVAIDSSGDVVEACRPGAEWAAAEGI